MDTYMHKTMVNVVSLEKIEIIRSQEFMPSKVRLKFLKKMIILGPKTAILRLQFCRILVLGPHFWWSGGARAPGPLPGSAPACITGMARRACHDWPLTAWTNRDSTYAEATVIIIEIDILGGNKCLKFCKEPGLDVCHLQFRTS